jgi:hypothetical protein
MSDVEIAKAKVVAQAEQVKQETATTRAAEVLKALFPKASNLVIAGVIKEEFEERKPSRQPRVGDKGNLFRTKRDGEVVDLDAPDYWIKEYPDLASAQKQGKSSSGEVAIELAVMGISDLSVQSQLVKTYGLDHTAKLMSLVGGEFGKKLPKSGAAPSPILGAPSKDTNPWGPKAWNITEQGRLTRVLGLEKAKAICASAGAAWGQTRPPKHKIRDE